MVKKLFLAVMMAFTLSAGMFAQNVDELKARMNVHEGMEAPDFTLKNLDGEDVTLSTFRGQWVILDFWGSWCKYCVRAFPVMKEVYADYHPKGLQIIGIDCKESQELWRAAVERFQLPWINVYNPEPKEAGVLAEYGVVAFPTMILINPEGKIYGIYFGEDPVLLSLLQQIYKD